MMTVDEQANTLEHVMLKEAGRIKNALNQLYYESIALTSVCTEAGYNDVLRNFTSSMIDTGDNFRGISNRLVRQFE